MCCDYSSSQARRVVLQNFNVMMSCRGISACLSFSFRLYMRVQFFRLLGSDHMSELICLSPLQRWFGRSLEDLYRICGDSVFPMERREPVLLQEDANSSSGVETSATAVSLMDGLSLNIDGTNVHHQIALEQTIWSSLPEHLVDCILAWLPVDCFFRVRSVCKRWNCLMYSKPYLDSLSRVASQGLYVLMFTGFSQHQVGATYNLALNRWHGIPFSYFLSCPNTGPVNVLATSGGLMCLRGMGTQLHTLYVSNPMRKEQRKLPPMLYMKSPYVLGMVVQRDKKGYKIVVAQDGDFVTSQVYDSRSNSWSMTGTLHRRSALVCGGTFLDGYLYCTMYGPHGIVCFNLENGTWHDTEIPLPPSLTTCDLLERRGSLIMVGGIEKYGLLDSVRVWQLDIATKTCVELRRMPDKFFRMLFQSAGFHFLCVGHEDLICFHETHSRNTLMYDFGKDLWKWLPNRTIQHLESRGLWELFFNPDSTHLFDCSAECVAMFL